MTTAINTVREEHKRLEFNRDQISKSIADLEREKTASVEDVAAFARACEGLEKAKLERERLDILLRKSEEKVANAERDMKRAELAASAKRLAYSQDAAREHAEKLAAAISEFYEVHTDLGPALAAVDAERAVLTQLEAELGEKVEGVERRAPDALARAHFLLRLRDLNADFNALCRSWVVEPPRNDDDLLGALRPLLGGGSVSDTKYPVKDQVADLLADTYGARMRDMEAANKARREANRPAVAGN